MATSILLPVALPPNDPRRQMAATLPAALPSNPPVVPPQQAPAPPAQLPATSEQVQPALAGQYAWHYGRLQQAAAQQQQAQQRAEEAMRRLEDYEKQLATPAPEMPTQFPRPKWWEILGGMALGALGGYEGGPLGMAAIETGGQLASRQKALALARWQADWLKWSTNQQQLINRAKLAEDAASFYGGLSRSYIETVNSIAAMMNSTMLDAVGVAASHLSPQQAQFYQNLAADVATQARKYGITIKPPAFSAGMDIRDAQALLQTTLERARLAAEQSYRIQDLALRRQEVALRWEEVKTQRGVAAAEKILSVANSTIQKEFNPWFQLAGDALQLLSGNREQAIQGLQMAGTYLGYLKARAGGRILRSEMQFVERAMGRLADFEATVNSLITGQFNPNNILGNEQNVRALKMLINNLIRTGAAYSAAYSAAVDQAYDLAREGTADAVAEANKKLTEALPSIYNPDNMAAVVVHRKGTDLYMVVPYVDVKWNTKEVDRIVDLYHSDPNNEVIPRFSDGRKISLDDAYKLIEAKGGRVVFSLPGRVDEMMKEMIEQQQQQQPTMPPALPANTPPIPGATWWKPTP